MCVPKELDNPCAITVLYTLQAVNPYQENRKKKIKLKKKVPIFFPERLIFELQIYEERLTDFDLTGVKEQ